MKRLFLFLFLICTFFISSASNALTDKKGVAVFPLDTAINSSSYAIYSKAQDMFSSDLVNALKKYNDTDVIDVYAGENILKAAGVHEQYEKLSKQYKQRYVVDYDKADVIAKTLGVNYLVFIHGGFDTEKDFLKSNWKYRCQWIWANPVKSSALLMINIIMIDVNSRNIVFQSSVKKDIPMDDFYQPAQNFGENVVPIAQLKNFTVPNSDKIAQQLHSLIYPSLNEKYSQKDAFIDKYIPNNGTIDTYGTNVKNIPQNNSGYTNEQPTTFYQESFEPATNNVNSNPRKDMYKNWVQEKL